VLPASGARRTRKQGDEGLHEGPERREAASARREAPNPPGAGTPRGYNGTSRAQSTYAVNPNTAATLKTKNIPRNSALTSRWPTEETA
jgi:hypothetical protein